MKGAKELADMIAAEKLIVCGYEEACKHDHPYDTRTLLKALAGALEFAEPLITRLAVIDSAVPGEVVGIQQRTDEAHLWDGCPPRRCEEAEKDRVDLLAIVHSQAGIIADLRRRPAESRALRAEIERDEARAEVAQLTDRVRTMQHGEAEALKMMATERDKADKLADGIARYRQLERECPFQLMIVDTWESDHGSLVPR